MMSGPRISSVIAGGGIGGLATAIALAKRGIASQLLERRPEFPEEGAGIQIGPNGTRILRDLGVGDLLQDDVAAPDALSVRDGATGQELTCLPLGAWIAERHGAPYWTAHRKDLHNALRRRAEAEPLITLKTGVEIVSFENDRDGFCAIGAQGDVLKASMLVAADGLWSGLRQRIAGPQMPKSFGKSAYRSVVESERLPHGLSPNAVHIWLAPGAHAVHYPIRGGREIALVLIADDMARGHDWDAPATAEAAQERVRDFADDLKSLVAAAQGWRQWSLHDVAPLETWSLGRATLLGDAAHPVLPFLAQGAVMALEDAVTLAEHVARPGADIATSLRAYGGARQPRVAQVAEASRRNGRIYHLRGAAALARNSAMRVTPPRYVMASFDWLYGWRLAPC